MNLFNGKLILQSVEEIAESTPVTSWNIQCIFQNLSGAYSAPQISGNEVVYLKGYSADDDSYQWRAYKVTSYALNDKSTGYTLQLDYIYFEEDDTSIVFAPTTDDEECTVGVIGVKSSDTGFSSIPTIGDGIDVDTYQQVMNINLKHRDKIYGTHVEELIQEGLKNVDVSNVIKTTGGTVTGDFTVEGTTSLANTTMAVDGTKLAVTSNGVATTISGGDVSNTLSVASTNSITNTETVVSDAGDVKDISSYTGAIVQSTDTINASAQGTKQINIAGNGTFVVNATGNTTKIELNSNGGGTDSVVNINATSGTISLNGASVELNGDVNAKNNLTIGNGLSVTADSNFNGVINAKKGITVDETLQANGDVTIDGTLTANGTSTFNDVINAKKGITVDETLQANNDVVIDGNLTGNSQTTLNGEANINNSLNVVGGDITVFKENNSEEKTVIGYSSITALKMFATDTSATFADNQLVTKSYVDSSITDNNATLPDYSETIKEIQDEVATKISTDDCTLIIDNKVGSLQLSDFATDSNHRFITDALLKKYNDYEKITENAQLRTEKNVVNGYAGLDENGKLLTSVMPYTILDNNIELITRTEYNAKCVNGTFSGTFYIVVDTDTYGESIDSETGVLSNYSFYYVVSDTETTVTDDEDTDSSTDGSTTSSDTETSEEDSENKTGITTTYDGVNTVITTTVDDGDTTTTTVQTFKSLLLGQFSLNNKVVNWKSINDIPDNIVYTTDGKIDDSVLSEVGTNVGTFNSVTVDKYGRVVSATSQNYVMLDDKNKLSATLLPDNVVYSDETTGKISNGVIPTTYVQTGITNPNTDKIDNSYLSNDVVLTNTNGKISDTMLSDNVVIKDETGKIADSVLSDNVVLTDATTGKISNSVIPTTYVQTGITNPNTDKIDNSYLSNDVVLTNTNGKISDTMLSDNVVITDETGKIANSVLSDNVVLTESDGKIADTKLSSNVVLLGEDGKINSSYLPTTTSDGEDDTPSITEIPTTYVKVGITNPNTEKIDNSFLSDTVVTTTNNKIDDSLLSANVVTLGTTNTTSNTIDTSYLPANMVTTTDNKIDDSLLSVNVVTLGTTNTTSNTIDTSYLPANMVTTTDGKIADSVISTDYVKVGIVNPTSNTIDTSYLPSNLITTDVNGKLADSYLSSNVVKLNSNSKIDNTYLSSDVVTTTNGKIADGVISTDYVKVGITNPTSNTIDKSYLPSDIVTTDSNGKVADSLLSSNVVLLGSDSKISDNYLSDNVAMVNATTKTISDSIIPSTYVKVGVANTSTDKIDSSYLPSNVVTTTDGKVADSLLSSNVVLLGEDGKISSSYLPTTTDGGSSSSGGSGESFAWYTTDDGLLRYYANKGGATVTRSLGVFNIAWAEGTICRKLIISITTNETYRNLKSPLYTINYDTNHVIGLSDEEYTFDDDLETITSLFNVPSCVLCPDGGQIDKQAVYTFPNEYTLNLSNLPTNSLTVPYLLSLTFM